MSARKETQIFPPGYKAPAASKSSKPARKSQLSQEIVVESDDSSEGQSSSDVTSESGSDSEGSKNQSRTSPRKTAEKRDRQETKAPANVRPTSLSKSLLGFEPVVNTKPGGPRASSVFSPSNLSGKEIWHITIPSSVPIKSFSEVTSLDDIEKGKVVAKHNGVDYGFLNEENTLSRTKLMVPSQSNGEYRAVNRDFAKTLHLQLNSHPLNTARRQQEHGTESQLASSSQGQSQKRARKQPKGLKLRFVPAGARATHGDQTGWSSSEETSDEEQGRSRFHNKFQVPKGLEDPAQTETGEHAEDSEGQRRMSVNPSANHEGHRRRAKDSHDRDAISKLMEGVIEPNAHKSASQSSHYKIHQGEQERMHKKRKAEPERDEHGRRKETSVERVRRKKKEKEQRKDRIGS